MLPTTHRTIYNHDYSSQVPRKNTFEIEESKAKAKWYRQYMTLEVFYFVSMVLIFYRLQAISNQNDRVLEIVNSMQSQFGNIERKIELLVSQKPTQNFDSQLDNTKPLEQSIADVLKSMKLLTQDSMEPIIPQVKQSTSETAEGIAKVRSPKEPYLFNAADLLRGASVDIAQSSSPSLNSIIGYEKTNFVLLDRPQSPSDKAWCTNDENPVLTINLAKYIKPISVSYQHSKWNGTIPNGAPRTYDVVACLDFYCEKWKPLVSNCQYSQYESNEAEQICNISSHPDVPSIGKVQFRFRENYGNTKMTCVHLVRVYGEIPVKIDENQSKSEEICADLRWYYHNRNFKKSTLTDKNCTLLYEHNCCSECPECCQECLISDDYRPTVTDYVHLIILLVLALLIWLTFFAVIIIALVKIIKFLAKFLTNFFSKMRGLNQVKK